MHPLLGRLSFGEASLPWVVPCGVLLALGVASLLLGLRRKEQTWVLVGGAILVLAAAAGWKLRGTSYVFAPLPFPAGGTLLALGCGVLGWSLLRRSVERGEDRATAETVLAWAAIGALVGARVTFVVLAGLPVTDLVSFGEGGFSGAGALLGGAVAAAWACRRAGLDVFAWLDAAAPALAFAIVAARLGCYLEGCDFGPPLPPSAPPWLAALGTFPRWSPNDAALLGAGPPVLLHQIATGALPATAARSLAVHPTALYEVVLALGLLALCWALGARSPFRGARGLLVLGGYALGSVALSPWHADPERGAGTVVLLALGATAVVVLGGWRWRTYRGRALELLRESARSEAQNVVES